MIDHGRWATTLGWLVAVALLAPSWIQTELLRCIGPDGKMIYTDNKALCPEAKPFEPKGELIAPSGVGSSEARAVAPSPAGNSLAERRRRAEARQAAFEAEESEAKRWKSKQEKLQADVDALAKKRAQLERFITNCNRGGLVWSRDDAGIKRKVKCSKIKEEYASLGAAEERASAALAALPEECRKAGCLPGWLR